MFALLTAYKPTLMRLVGEGQHALHAQHAVSWLDMNWDRRSCEGAGSVG
jgi:hypothetical protein